MTPVIFRCPVNKIDVQWQYTPHVEVDDNSAIQRFEPVNCPACGRTHLLNRATGRIRVDSSPSRLR